MTADEEYGPLPVRIKALQDEARRAVTRLAVTTYRRAGHLHVSTGDLQALREHLLAPEDGGVEMWGLPVVALTRLKPGAVTACEGPPLEPVRALVIGGGSLDGRWITLEHEVPVLSADVDRMLVPPGEAYLLTVLNAFGRRLRLYVGPCDDLDERLARHLLNPQAATIERVVAPPRPAWLN